MKNIILFFEGFLIGVGNVIPGVSGSVLAIMFGLYEKMVESVSSLKNFIKNIKFLFIIGMGISLAIILGSNVIRYLLINHYLKTMMFFIGMMIPGLIPLIKNVNKSDISRKNIIICLGVICILVVLSLLEVEKHVVFNKNYFFDFISLFLCGLVDAFCTVVPGISGSAILMLLGYYEIIIAATADILCFSTLAYNLKILIPFYIGTGMGIIVISKLIDYFFKNHRTLTYMLIIVFALYSLVLIIINTTSMMNNIGTLLAMLPFACLGYLVTYILDRAFN